MQRRILLASPGFHGYWRAIAAAFESLGYEVVAHCYDTYSALGDRLQNKLLHDLPGSVRWQAAADSATDQAVARLRNDSWDAVVVVKGDQLGASWWSALQESGLPKVTWLYDEIRRTHYSPEILAEIGPVASYSRVDVGDLRQRGVEAEYLPLGYDSLSAYAPLDSGSVTLVGARYPNRERLLRDVQAGGVPVRAYGREWSRGLWDVLRTRRLRGPGVPSGGDLDRASAYGVMAGSLATLNVHSNQDGFTMRTFEAAGVGALELVDRDDVSEFYEVGTEVLEFSTANEVIDAAERARRDVVWASAIRNAAQRRTLAEHTLVHRASALEKLWA